MVLNGLRSGLQIDSGNLRRQGTEVFKTSRPAWVSGVMAIFARNGFSANGTIYPNGEIAANRTVNEIT
jgi:hypothetical protein